MLEHSRSWVLKLQACSTAYPCIYEMASFRFPDADCCLEHPGQSTALAVPWQICGRGASQLGKPINQREEFFPEEGQWLSCVWAGACEVFNGIGEVQTRQLEAG